MFGKLWAKHLPIDLILNPQILHKSKFSNFYWQSQHSYSKMGSSRIYRRILETQWATYIIYAVANNEKKKHHL